MVLNQRCFEVIKVQSTHSGSPEKGRNRLAEKNRTLCESS